LNLGVLLACISSTELKRKKRIKVIYKTRDVADKKAESTEKLDETMKQVKQVKIFVEWKKEAKVWVVTSADIFGLAAEAGTLPALEDRLKKILPGLFELNGVKGDVALIISP
jgi:hypothetical protein